MKRILTATAILTMGFFLLTSFVSLREKPQDPPRGKKTEKHINLVKVDENGKKTELDTVIHGDQIFVWNGDTIGGAKELKWITKEDFTLDSLHKNMDINFDFDIQEDDNGKVFIVKPGKGAKPMMSEFTSEDDSAKTFNIKVIKEGGPEHGNVMYWNSDDGHKTVIVTPDVAGVPPVPPVPPVPGLIFRGKGNKASVIDLSDPNVISFKKKKMNGGREKITVIRKEVKENDMETEDVIIKRNLPHPVMIHEATPGNTQRIKVIKKDDGTEEVIEESGTWSINEKDENVKVIKEDGKIIHIKEIKEGDNKKVEVKVEVKEEKQENK